LVERQARLMMLVKVDGKETKSIAAALTRQAGVFQ
jgi:IS30 family transposase